MTTAAPKPPAAKPPAPPPPPPPPAAPPHATNTSYTDLPVGTLNLQFHDVSNVWSATAQAATTKLNPNHIRKILIHHHAGPPYDFSKKHKTQKANSGEGMPTQVIDFAGRDDYQNKAYGYHYDIPFVEEKAADPTRVVVYRMKLHNEKALHTGAGQNEIGLGISLCGSMRSYAEFLEAQSYGKNFSTPAEYTTSPGLPSQHQRRALPVLVRFLQEMYDISNCHVQGHFQHSKPTCPGYDTERWLIHYEDESRRQGKGFCYPVQIEAGGGVPFLNNDPAKELARAKKYLLNTRSGRSGFYPFGRRGFWHNGVHLYPPAGAGAPVYAVRDGWVLAARFEKSVKVDGFDYGSAAFVLVQHEDPGFWPADGKLHDTIPMQRWNKTSKTWETFNASIAVQPTYCSLYMHLGPLTNSIAWVKKLETKDPTLYAKVMADKATTHTFQSVSLPVRAGDIIGGVGTHDPFAAMSKTAKVEDAEVFNAKNKAVLHFEMFSVGNLVERLEDKGVGGRWQVKDADANALAELVTKKLPGVAGMKLHLPMLDERLAAMEKGDAQHADPSRLSGALNDDLLEPLSSLITSHASEWSADWKAVLAGWHRDFGLAPGKNKKETKAIEDAEKKRTEKTVKHHLDVISQFQFGVAIKDYRNRPLGGKEAYPYYYHPIRFLNWLNGLTRTADVPSLPYNTYTDVTPFDVAPRKLKVVKLDAQNPRQLTIAKNTGSPKVSDHTKLVGTRVFFPPSKEVYRITAVTETKTGLDLTVDPQLSADIKQGATMRVGGNGWSWEAKFKWETNILGVTPPTPPPAPAPASPAKGGKK